eukprot:11411324-Alexandrium_andersonii.AAC.1
MVWKLSGGQSPGRGARQLGESCRAYRAIEAAPPASWAQVRGPLGALAQTLGRLGWSSEGPLLLIDDLGVRRPVFGIAPKMWERLARAAYCRMLERQAGQKLKWDEGARPFVEDARRIIEPSFKGLGDLQKACLETMLRGA